MMGMTEFVWRLHGGFKGYSRAVLRDWPVWLIVGVLLWEGVMSWGVGLFVAVILLNHAIVRMHLEWYRGALVQTQRWLDHSIAYMKKDQAQKWREMIEREKTHKQTEFN